VRSERDLLPVHSSASTATEMTPTTGSDCSYGPLVSVHPSLELAECSLRKLLCIADGKMERGVIGRLEGLEKMIMRCVDIFPVVLPSTRSTGRVLSTAGG